MKIIGKVRDIDIKCEEINEETHTEDIWIEEKDLTSKVRKKIREKEKEIAERESGLGRFLESPRREVIISKDVYETLLDIKDSILNHRSIPNRLFFGYLLQSLTLEELKQICRDYNLTHYSTLRRQELIEYIKDSFSEEEIRDFLIEREGGIISKSIAEALGIMNGKGKEKLEEIKTINKNIHEIELSFEGFKWETQNYVIINKETIKDPERYCDCKEGNEGGFCPHFWIAFAVSVKRGYLSLDDWKLTKIPPTLRRLISLV